MKLVGGKLWGRYGVYVMAAHADAVGGDDFKLAKFLFLISYLFGLINETSI